MMRNAFLRCTIAVMLAGAALGSLPARALAASQPAGVPGAYCDGQHDDSAAFRAALDGMQGSGGTLALPQGATCLISPSSFVTVPSGVTLRGDGATLAPSQPGFNLLEVSGDNISIENLTVDGEFAVVRGVTIDGGFSGVTLTNVTIAHVSQPTDPSTPGYGADRYQVAAGLRVQGDGHGLLLQDIHVDGVHATNIGPLGERPVARGVWISPTALQGTSTDLSIVDSSFADVTPKDDGDCIVAQGNASDANTLIGLTIARNTFTGCAKRAIKLQLSGAVVTGNRIDNPFNGNNPFLTFPPSVDTFDMYSGISVYASHVVVSNNTLSGVGSFYVGIELGAGTPDTLEHLVVHDNAVAMGSTSRIGGSSAIRSFNPISGSLIDGNTLSYANWGIWLTTADRSIIANNSFDHIAVPYLCTGTCPTIPPLGADGPPA
jgi:parallel beta-helix repeat protein